MIKRFLKYFSHNPTRIESKLYFTTRTIWRRAQTREIPIDTILCGSIAGLSTSQLYRHTGDIKWASSPIAESPHALFLETYKQQGEAVFTQASLERTQYYAFVRQSIDLFGNFCGARSKSQIIYIAKNFVRKYHGNAPDNSLLSSNADCSYPNDPVELAPILDSDCYQIIDGHHRVACSVARGRTSIRARVRGPARHTPLQALLLSVRWCVNRTELYQPVNSPELVSHWTVLRRCSDRLKMMNDFLAMQPYTDAHSNLSYLDVACYYGWFVDQMAQRGYTAQGIELDAVAKEVGSRIYGLHDSQIIRADAVSYLRTTAVTYDIVSCFSLMHHFVIGLGSTSPEELLSLLARVTQRVLFFEMGEGTERWFVDTPLATWNSSTIFAWLKKSQLFKNVIRLGTDADRVVSLGEVYGRTTFACIK